MKKSLVIIFLLFLILSSAHAIPIGIKNFSDSAKVIDFDDIAPGEAIKTQFEKEFGVTFSGSPLQGDPFPGSTINGTPTAAKLELNFVNPVIAEFASLQNKVGMYFGTPPGGPTTVQIQAFRRDSDGSLVLKDSETFTSPTGDVPLGATVATVFAGLSFDGGFHKIEFGSTSGSPGFDIDDFRFELSDDSVPGPKPIPEPTTILLLCAGLLRLAGFRRKKFFRK